MSGRSLVWSRTSACHNINWSMYRSYLGKKYNRQYTSLLYSYGLKYSDYLQNVSKISELPTSIKSNVLKALISLSKYLGCYNEFTKSFKSFGIKWSNGDSFSGFLNIINGRHEDLIQWFKDTNALPENERLFLKFTLITGLRKSESVMAFNMVLDLNAKNELDTYYNAETSMLEHFKFPKLFLRNSKNAYVSVVSRSMINEIANSKPISYSTLRKHLAKSRLKLRIKELRSYNNSYFRKHNILSEYIDILSGRIPKSVFVRHYLKETLADLSRQIQPIQEQILGSVS